MFRAIIISSVALTLTGCSLIAPPRQLPVPDAPVPSPVPAPPTVQMLLDVTWVAFAIDGVPEVLPPKPTLRWDRDDHVVGTGGCNGFSGKASANLPTLTIGPIKPTGKACLTLPGAQEDKFFAALEQTRSAERIGHQLVLRNSQGAVTMRLTSSQ